ncbi:glycosyltransferase family 4 protein [Halostella sp. JP-L12]|uniref:glycosyltransferase family 4 protein n=1 Tax=Halostella TaxID=1843185 RepID=UPI000EF8296F|nr:MULTISPECIES: glycosyltransferase family 4 protein [Halostella]NHN48471.1 glycosyltransferase family 4 protein [Halostella sp. JP-L12]
MRVGLVVYGDLGATSGGFRYDRRLAAALRDAGHAVEPIELPWRPWSAALAHNLSPRVRRRLRGYDLLVVDELCHPSLAGVVARVDAPTVAVVHHLRSRERHPRPLRAAYRAVERRFLRGVDAALCVSEATRRDVRALANVPTAVAPPAVDRFGDLPSRERIRERAGEDPFRIAFVGNVVPRKGLDALLRGVARLPREGWRLDAVGDLTVDPAYAERCRRLAADLSVADRTRFRGRLSDRNLAGVLARSHVLAVPSQYEGFGIVYLEGMAFGLPALATTAGGASAIVEHGETGRLLPPDDPAALAAALRDLRDDRGRLRDRSLAARDRSEAHPSWDESMARARDFLRCVANGEASTGETTADAAGA